MGMPAAARRAGDDIGVGQVPLPVGQLGLDLGIARQGCQFHGRFLTCAAAPPFHGMAATVTSRLL